MSLKKHLSLSLSLSLSTSWNWLASKFVYCVPKKQRVAEWDAEDAGLPGCDALSDVSKERSWVFPNLIRHVQGLGLRDPEDEGTTILRIAENSLPNDAS